MKLKLLILIALLLHFSLSHAQVEPSAGSWKTWLISSGKDYRLAQPGSYKSEIATVLSAQKALTEEKRQQIAFWNAGSPGYRWQAMMAPIWQRDTGRYGVLANMILGVAIYDATIAAWNTKYAYNRSRPFSADNRIKCLVPKPESPGYPCEHSVAAGVAVAVFSQFYPHLKDSVIRMAERAMASRVAAGVAFPSDTKAGFELGKKIALEEIKKTEGYVSKAIWDGKMPVGKQYWKGAYAMHPMAGKNKTMALDSASQYRPGPPPDFTKDMAELKAFKQTFRSQANAWYYASQNSGDDMLMKKVFEYNVHLNPPLAAKYYAAAAVGFYDAFIACWDAKYHYWGARPNQFDTTYVSLIQSPPFPGYPSGHAVMSGLTGELYSYFFPSDSAYFRMKAREAAESRFQAGIHFRSDNDAGLELGRKIAEAVIRRMEEGELARRE